MFVRNLTLPRAKMTVAITLELFECDPGTRRLADEVVVRSPGPLGDGLDPETGLPLTPHVFDAEEVVADALSLDAQGRQLHPPDEIREIHGLPIATPARHPGTKQTVDVMVDSRPEAPPPEPEASPEASPYPLPEVGPGKIAATLDRGAPVTQVGMRDYQLPVGAGVLGAKNAERARPEVGVQADFKENVLKKERG